MALSALNWRYVGTVTFVSGIVNALDAVYNLGQNVTYADGSARTPGSGSAWTWAREQSAGTTVAAYGTPPINALTMKYIIGGTVGASAYTFLTPDNATLANCIVYGMNRASGAYTTWTSATPFTNAGFSGYWRGTRAFATVAYDSVAMWESQEGCVIQFGQASTGSTSTIGFGAMLDPLSSNALNAESDGRLYTMWGSGSLSVTSSTWANTSGDGCAWLQNGGGIGTSHCGTFAPGTNVMLGGAGAQTARLFNSQPGTSFVSTNGDIARVPMTAVGGVNGNFFGQTRQIYLVKDAQSRLTWQNGATVIGYVWSPTLNAVGDAVVMTY